MSVDNTDNKLVLTRAPIETDKPSFQPDTVTFCYSSSTPRTALTSALYPSDAVPSVLMIFSTSIKNI